MSLIDVKRQKGLISALRSEDNTRISFAMKSLQLVQFMDSRGIVLNDELTRYLEVTQYPEPSKIVTIMERHLVNG